MLKFEKYHGTGNDFIIIEHFDGITPSKRVQKMCDRHFGIGADGLMCVEPSEIADVKMAFYNADGSIAPMCGNGIRCFAKHVYDHKIVTKSQFNVETLAGIMKVDLQTDEHQNTSVTINMGTPDFTNAFGEVHLAIDNTAFQLNTLIMGTLHAVIFVDALDTFDIEKYGKAIESHALFPERINANFVEVVDSQTIKVSTYERGVGRTLSCGTGSAASAVVSNKMGFTHPKVDVNVPGGQLNIDVTDDGIFMTGPAVRICSGAYNDTCE